MVKRNMRRVGRRSKRNPKWMIIGVLSALFIFSTGYAILATRLNIRGTSQISANFNVYIASITEKKVYKATTNSASVGSDKLTASFDVDLDLPGSYAEYTVIVKNDSNFNVALKEITGIDEANQKMPKEIQYSINGITKGEVLNQGSQKEFTVRVDFDSTATSLPSTGKTLEIELNYEQAVDPSTLPPTTETCFETTSPIDGEIIGGVQIDPDTSTVITNYVCDDETVVIPDQIDGKNVIEISPAAFASKNLKQVVLPDMLLSIGPQAFDENNLTTITIPQQVSVIGENAFLRNPITSITLTEGITTISEGAFSYIDTLETPVIIPSTVISIGARAFSDDITHFINLTGRSFDWLYVLTGETLPEMNCTFVTGTCLNTVVSSS